MRIIYKDSDGVKVIIPSPNYLRRHYGSTDELVKKRVPEGLDYKIVSDDAIPSDRYFRNAWDLKSGKITTDITKAKEIKKEYLRQERKPLLEALDVDYMRALETKSDTVSITAEKQRLRDITKLCDDCKTVEELKAIKIETIFNK